VRKQKIVNEGLLPPRTNMDPKATTNMEDIEPVLLQRSTDFMDRSARQGLGCRSPALFLRPKVSLLPIHGEQIRDHISGYGECRPVAISFLLLPVIDHRQFMALSGRALTMVKEALSA
jgi:hypothetical protein